MAGFSQCSKCAHGFYAKEPISDFMCIYILDVGRSRDTSHDTDTKCGDYKPIGKNRRESIIFSEHSTPRRSGAGKEQT